MTVEEFIKRIDNAEVPYNATILSDSGWECDPTECSRILFDQEDNVIVLTQEIIPSGYVGTVNWREI